MNDVAHDAALIGRAESAHGAILFDRMRAAQAEIDWLDPAHWHGAEAESKRGGRGAVWLVRGEFGEAVLRHYRRGGLIGRLNADRYLWSGAEATRSFREFRLLAALRDRGFPVPTPLVAGFRRHGAYYRADLLTLLIPDAQTLAQRLRSDFPETAIWERIGATLARFHAAGVWHADLNAHNLMIDARDEVWLIDFDRGELRVPEADWQLANLARLERSLLKLEAGAHPGWASAWEALLVGYRRMAAPSEGDR